MFVKRVMRNMRTVPSYFEYDRIDKVKREILSDPIYSKCPICSRRIVIKMDFMSWYAGFGAFAQIKCGRKLFPHVKSIECGKAQMSRALEHAFREWKKEYNKRIPIEYMRGRLHDSTRNKR